jgi:hypothetical protein
LLAAQSSESYTPFFATAGGEAKPRCAVAQLALDDGSEFIQVGREVLASLARIMLSQPLRQRTVLGG